MGDGVSLTDNEWILMRIIWKYQPCTLRRICDEANRHHSWSRHAVISFLKRMEQKGAIAVEEAEPCRLYRAIWDSQVATADKINATLDSVFDDNPMMMISCLADAREYSDSEIQEMIDILQKKRGKRHEH